MKKPHRDSKTVLYRHTLFMLSVFALCISQWTAAQTPGPLTESATISPGDSESFAYNFSQLRDLVFKLTKPAGMEATMSFTGSMGWVVYNSSYSFDSCDDEATITFKRPATDDSILPESLFHVFIRGAITICRGEGEGTTPGYEYTLNTQANLNHIITADSWFAVIEEGLLLEGADATLNEVPVAVDWPSPQNGYNLVPDGNSKTATFTATEPGVYDFETTGMSGTAYADSTFPVTVTVPKVEIKEAEYGGPPPEYLGVNEILDLTAQIDPDIITEGTFVWTSSALVVIAQNADEQHKATVTAQETPSSGQNDVEIKVIFTHTESGKEYEATHRLTVLKIESIEGLEEVCKGSEESFQIVTSPPGQYSILEPTLVGCTGSWQPSTGVMTVQFNTPSNHENDKKSIVVSFGNQVIVKDILVIDGKLNISPIPNNMVVPNAFTPDIQEIINILGVFFEIGQVESYPVNVIISRYKICCVDDVEASITDWLIQFNVHQAAFDLELGVGVDTIATIFNRLKAMMMAVNIPTEIVDNIIAALNAVDLTLAGISGGYNGHFYNTEKHLDECKCDSGIQERWAGSTQKYVNGEILSFDPSSYPINWPGDAPPLAFTAFSPEIEHRKYSALINDHAYVWEILNAVVISSLAVGNEQPLTYYWVNEITEPILLNNHSFCPVSPITSY